MNKTLTSLCLTTCLITSSSAADWDKLTEKIKANEYQQMTSVVVSHNKQIIYEEYFNQGGPEVKNDMRSASKSMTSMAIGLAIDDGLIQNVDQAVLPFFADKQPLKNPDSRKTAMTIEDLLTMSSLLECDDWNSASRGNEERMYIIEDWTAFILGLPIKGTPPWRTTPANSPYGRAFSYCSGGVQVLTDLVERVSKQSMSDYLQVKLFKPLAIEAPVFSQSPMGVTNGAGGMRMSSRDWIKIGQLMMNQGVYNQQQILSANWVKASLSRKAVINADRNQEYAYLWWVFDFKVNDQTITAYAAAGNGGNYLFMLPSLNAQVVITSTAYNTNYMHQQSQEILTDHVIPRLIKLQ